MGNTGPQSLQNSLNHQKSLKKQDLSGKRLRMTTFKYIEPKNLCQESIEQILDQSFQSREKQQKEKIKTNTPQEINNSVNFSKKGEDLQKTKGKQNIKGSTKQQRGQIEIKKVKVKWNQFIKMKNKKFSDDYFTLKQIGKGGFGCVYKVIMKNGKMLRAAKKILKASLKAEEHENLLSQMAIMMSLDHPNIAKLFEVYDQKEHYVMVMELCEGGQLFQKIVDGDLAEDKIASVAKQVLSALNYMHNKEFVHRDIKPQNMLFEKNTDLIKLIDFGISTKIKKKQYLTERVGTPYYISPQVLYKKYNSKCDIWSLGVVTYMMVTGSPPFKGSSCQQIMERIIYEEPTFVGSAWRGASPDCIMFIKKMLAKNLNQRPSASKALEHPWLKSQKQLKHRTSQKQQIMGRMQKFRFKNKLQAVVHTYVASQLFSNEEKADLLNYFKEIDKNENGVIQIQQLKYAFHKNIKLTKEKEEKIKKMIDYIDTNCSGQIDYTQFLVSALNFDEKIKKRHLEQAFSYFDIDNSGEITFEEISQFLDDGNENIKEIFNMVDENGDGVISKKQFVNLLINRA